MSHAFRRPLAVLAFALMLAAPALAQAPQPAQPSPAAPPAGATMMKATPARPVTAELLDINSATPEELDALPGVGEARVKAIIAGRPYKGKDELVQKKILPKAVYDKIKDKIIAKQK